MHETPRLLATCWTTAGSAKPDTPDPRSPISIEQRIAAAAADGWRGFGLVHADLVEFTRTRPLSALRSMLDDHGIEQVELELIEDWWLRDPRPGGATATGAPTEARAGARIGAGTGADASNAAAQHRRRRAAHVVRRDVFAAAEALGARTVKVAPDTAAGDVPPDLLAERFDALATEAGEHGTRVALEFLPFAERLSSLSAGIELVTQVANPAGGLCVDIWHVARAGTDYGIVAESLPVEYLFAVELNDAAPEVVGTLFEDTVHRRLLPGAGCFDVPAFINAIRATGFDGMWGVEMLSDRHRSLPLEQALSEARAAAFDCFAEADRRLR